MNRQANWLWCKFRTFVQQQRRTISDDLRAIWRVKEEKYWGDAKVTAKPSSHLLHAWIISNNIVLARQCLDYTCLWPPSQPTQTFTIWLRPFTVLSWSCTLRFTSLDGKNFTSLKDWPKIIWESSLESSELLWINMGLCNYRRDGGKSWNYID